MLKTPFVIEMNSSQNDVFFWRSRSTPAGLKLLSISLKYPNNHKTIKTQFDLCSFRDLSALFHLQFVDFFRRVWGRPGADLGDPLLYYSGSEILITRLQNNLAFIPFSASLARHSPMESPSQRSRIERASMKRAV
jgi:hypothetical protein